ncbi:protein jag [Paucidesulfovibrio longus]|uniref:protein jag n=1 Tax=Paucidesulfovibrio longus TaxID=889 RepID=UPI0003B623E2|nr:protein jag [Paucidesulfovibrio longus]
MSDFKEFQGKNLDEAIQAACDYYEVARAKLEIEILSGGSTGIFGLVGVRKASVKARPRRGVKSVLAEEAAQETKQHSRPESEPAESRAEAAPAREQEEAPQAQAEAADEEQPKSGSRNSRSRRGRRSRGKSQRDGASQDAAPQEAADPECPPEAGQNGSESQERKRQRRPRQEKPRQEAPKEASSPATPDASGEESPKRPPRRPVHEANPAPIPADRDEVPDFPPDDADDFDGVDDMDDMDEPNGNVASEDTGPSRGPSLEGLDQDKLREVVSETAHALLKNLTPEPNFTLNIESDRVHVLIDDEEHSGLIIGREGQTLSALQYLANRIVSRRMETSVRVQLDTGDYRERQDDKLRQQARRLAEKAISSRRTQSTKPLSSYHRRVVHLTVQEMPGVLTRSKGEGPLKRVLIVPKKRSR